MRACPLRGPGEGTVPLAVDRADEQEVAETLFRQGDPLAGRVRDKCLSRIVQEREKGLRGRASSPRAQELRRVSRDGGVRGPTEPMVHDPLKRSRYGFEIFGVQVWVAGQQAVRRNRGEDGSAKVPQRDAAQAAQQAAR